MAGVRSLIRGAVDRRQLPAQLWGLRFRSMVIHQQVESILERAQCPRDYGTAATLGLVSAPRCHSRRSPDTPSKCFKCQDAGGSEDHQGLSVHADARAGGTYSSGLELPE